MYNGNKIDPGGSLILTLTGSASGSTTSPATGDARTNLIIGLAALGLVLILVGWLLFRRAQQRGVAPFETGAPFEMREQKNEQDLIDAIIALDDLYKDGKLPEDAYQKRRADLKTQLRERLG
jgi:LPXTG-motif cell wall-anchored protein